MDFAEKDKWVQALYSGDYEQTKGRLKNIDGDKESFCCLGVLCEISGEGEWRNVSDDIDGWGEYMIGDANYGDTTSLPYRLKKKYGLTTDQTERLMEMNDGGHSFTEIGDWIRRNV